jgi:hypothetical protein
VVGELLEAYRRLEHRQYLMVVCLTISTIVTLAVLILYTQLNLTNANNIAVSAGLRANYSTLGVSSGAQIASLRQEVALASLKYNESEYNLTNPYSKPIYTNYQVNIPKRGVINPVTRVNSSGPIATFNTTYLQRYYTYNFSFNASYPGYLLLNATSTGANTQSNTTWEFLVGNSRILQNGTLDDYEFGSGTYYQGAYTPTVTNRGTYSISMNVSQPYSVYAPLPTQSSSSVRIPVDNGTVNVWIVNFANRSITVTFSAKYVGFHTR